MATHAQRHHIVEWLDFCEHHAKSLLYPPGDQRTARDGVSWHLTEQHFEHVILHGGKVQLDCSEFGSDALKMGGLWRWPEPGWTGSHLQLLPRYTNGKQARPGALVVFGLNTSPTGLHEAVVREADPKGGDPVVDSHGRNGLDRLHVSQFGGELRGHVYLSIAHL